MSAPTAKELVDKLKGLNPRYCGMRYEEAEELAARVEQVLALQKETFRPDGGEAQWSKGWNKALATVWRLLNGEKR